MGKEVLPEAEVTKVTRPEQVASGYITLRPRGGNTTVIPRLTWITTAASTGSNTTLYVGEGALTGVSPRTQPSFASPSMPFPSGQVAGQPEGAGGNYTFSARLDSTSLRGIG